MRHKRKVRATPKPKPTLLDESANAIGKTGEKHTKKALAGVLTPGSGAGRSKGDVMHGYGKTGRYATRGFKRMIEKKSTAAKSIKLEQDWLEKIEQQAFDAGKDPVLVVEFQTMSPEHSQWGLVPLEKLKELFELEDKYGEGCVDK